MIERFLDACRGLDELWPSTRYQNEPMPTADQVRQAVEWAAAIRRAVTSAGLVSGFGVRRDPDGEDDG